MRRSIEIPAAEREALALLAEEMGEATQLIGKWLRHGRTSSNPNIDGRPTNCQLLEVELGDVLAAITILEGTGGLSRETIQRYRLEKLARVGEFLHSHDNRVQAFVAEFRAQTIVEGIESEVTRATKLHPTYHSAHEGFAVLLEEVDELKAEVWKKAAERDYAAIEAEAIQVAAVAVRIVLSIVRGPAERSAMTAALQVGKL